MANPTETIPTQTISDDNAIAQMAMAESDSIEAPIIVIGAGPVGMHFIKQLGKLKPHWPIKVFGKENWAPYDRVGLSSFLAGKRSFDELQRSETIPDNADVFIGRAITEINRDEKWVCDDTGTQHPYHNVFIATGSHPHIPDIEGTALSGVFRFRDMKDAQSLIARQVKSRHTVVIGGGLLGIEAARAMAQNATKITLIQHSSHLMNRQLDMHAAALVQAQLSDAGVNVQLNTRVKEISGDQRVKKAILNNGAEIACDTVIFATGISPNIKLARDNGIKVTNGIRIDEHARTSDPFIYAGGECAQYEDEVFGLVAPGLEQASVAASVIAGETAFYHGSIGATQLKVLDLSCFSAGRVSDEWAQQIDRTYSWQSEDKQSYRRIYLRKGRIVGALSIGRWPEQSRLQSEIQKGTLIWPWQLLRFKSNGQVWPDNQDDNIAQWPATAIVCQCRQVTRGELSLAIEQGNDSVPALASCTHASTVCGSCEPLLANLCGDNEVHKNKFSKPFLALSILIAALLATALFNGAWQYAQSVADISIIEKIWRDGLFRQITGFTLLGLSAFAALLALRKRITRFALGNYQVWRTIHLVLGVLIVATLLVHTGFRLGSGSNFFLMITYLAILVVGAAAGIFLARSEANPKPARRSRTNLGIWLHIISLWPFPALLIVHIIKAYYY